MEDQLLGSHQQLFHLVTHAHSASTGMVMTLEEVAVVTSCDSITDTKQLLNIKGRFDD